MSARHIPTPFVPQVISLCSSDLVRNRPDSESEAGRNTWCADALARIAEVAMQCSWHLDMLLELGKAGQIYSLESIERDDYAVVNVLKHGILLLEDVCELAAYVEELGGQEEDLLFGIKVPSRAWMTKATLSMVHAYVVNRCGGDRFSLDLAERLGMALPGIIEALDAIQIEARAGYEHLLVAQQPNPVAPNVAEGAKGARGKRAPSRAPAAVPEMAAA